MKIDILNMPNVRWHKLMEETKKRKRRANLSGMNGKKPRICM